MAGRIVVIGGGIAGLCAAVHARLCGYEVELLEAHDRPGGLATSWQRDGYTFETCLHWLLGTRPGGSMYRRWQEVLDIASLRFVHPEEFVRLETEDGERLCVYTDLDRLEAEMLRRAPADAAPIGRFVAAVRRLARLELPEPGQRGLAGFRALLKLLPYLPTLRHWSRRSCEQCGRAFSDPLLRSFFGAGEMAELSAVALVFSLGWMSRQDGGYPIGGSQAVIRAIVRRLDQLGGRLRCGARVARILVEHDAAVGVRLEDGEVVAGDWVISAADGHATIYDLLGGRYRDRSVDRRYDTLKPFPSYLQVSLGVAQDLSDRPGFLTRILDTPIAPDPATSLSQLSFRIFHYDPTFAPPGKTAVTCALPTRAAEHWTRLRQTDPARYQDAKQLVAEAVIGVLERVVPGVRAAIEVVDVATPATVMRYTGNWQGSMEGWLLTPQSGFGPLPMTLPGLRRFAMAGQWVMPGGGLPSGLLTARAALRAICRADGTRFAG